jgi:hypothetical protein
MKAITVTVSEYSLIFNFQLDTFILTPAINVPVTFYKLTIKTTE